ncbi:granule-associated protein [Massilia phosphatilytica]|jgi:phasin family protein|nr:granule-associated protein [Massilia phosphatilytica]
MFLFSQSVTPAVRSHLDAQVAFLNDVSKLWSRSIQNIVEANIQLSQTLLEETNIASQQLLTTRHPTEAISAAAARAQPAAEKLRAYQQHLSRVVADSQVELARVAEQHVPQTSRTAKSLADEVARAASEETQNSLRTQQDTLKNFRDPFQQSDANGSVHRGNLQSGGNGAEAGARAEADARGASFQGNVQAGQQGKSATKAS